LGGRRRRQNIFHIIIHCVDPYIIGNA
jgi:hypothetical protein